MASSLTANSTISTWLNDPKGGPLLRALLAESGADAEALAPVSTLPLQQLVAMSQGQMPQSVVDHLVLQATTESSKSMTAPRPVAREGGRVIAVDVSDQKLAEFATSVPDALVVTMVAEITKQADVDAVVSAAGDRIDGLANIAGINDDFSPLHETSDQIWDRVIRVNLTGTFKLSRAVVPVMQAAGRGSIVNIASEAGLRGNASGNAYTVSKHGVIGLTRSAACMYGPEGIRINAVAPGGVATGIPMPSAPSEAGSARLSPFHNIIPSIATAEQLAASITFLLSDDGVNINGAVLPSDGAGRCNNTRNHRSRWRWSENDRHWPPVRVRESY